MADFYLRKIIQRRQILSALTYPSLVLITTFLSLWFLLNYVVPMFQDVFLRVQGELPTATRFVIGLSESFTKYLLIALIFIGIFITVNMYYRKTVLYRKGMSALLLRIPVTGRILALIYKVRFCQTMKLLLSANVHLLEAVKMTRDMIGFFPYERALESICHSLSHGKSLAVAMASFSIFDPKLVALTRVAEEVNKLDLIYERLYQQYSAELDSRIKSMNSILEPILIIFVGGLVAFILVSMYLPIFQLGSTIV